MTKEEFDELIRHLHFQSTADGDLGYAYWTKVIKQLKEMYAKTLVS